MKTIVALPGEGIGVEVVDATCEILTSAGVPVKIVTPAQYDTPGSPVPEATRRACREADAVLFGAAGPSTSNVVGWSDEVPKHTMNPCDATSSIARASDGPPTDSRITSNSPRAGIPTTTLSAPSSRSPSPRAALPTTAVTFAPR